MVATRRCSARRDNCQLHRDWSVSATVTERRALGGRANPPELNLENWWRGTCTALADSVAASWLRDGVRRLAVGWTWFWTSVLRAGRADGAAHAEEKPGSLGWWRRDPQPPAEWFSRSTADAELQGAAPPVAGPPTARSTPAPFAAWSRGLIADADYAPAQELDHLTNVDTDRPGPAWSRTNACAAAQVS